MKIGILGTGSVGRAIGSKLVQLGHEVKMGSRTAANEKAAEWVNSEGKGASAGTFSDAAAFGKIVFNCTSGLASMEALKLAGKENLNGKILVDVANPLDFSKGMPPTLKPCNTDSLAEQIQRGFPDVKVVKTLNTMNCSIMVNPSLLPGDHDVFICGNDNAAKDEIKKILGSIGWKSGNIIDMGDISNARGTEQLLPIWIRLYGTFKSGVFNFKIVR